MRISNHPPGRRDERSEGRSNRELQEVSEITVESSLNGPPQRKISFAAICGSLIGSLTKLVDRVAAVASGWTTLCFARGTLGTNPMVP